MMNHEQVSNGELSLFEKINLAHEKATKRALLEHARMGRSVCESDANGKVIWIPPVEIFARYGLDEFGRPIPLANSDAKPSST